MRCDVGGMNASDMVVQEDGEERERERESRVARTKKRSGASESNEKLPGWQQKQ